MKLGHARLGPCTRRIAAVSIDIQATSLHADRADHAAWCMPSPTRTSVSHQASVLLEPDIEAGRSVDVDHSHNIVTVIGKRVLQTGRNEDERPGAGGDVLARDPQCELAFENVEGVVLGRVS